MIIVDPTTVDDAADVVKDAAKVAKKAAKAAKKAAAKAATKSIFSGDTGMLGGILGGGTDSGSGLIGGLLLGSLLRNNGNLFGGDGTPAAAALAADRVTAADVQNIVTQNTANQSIGAIRGEIWQAEGQVQTAISASQNASTLATMNAEIANLQGQNHIQMGLANNFASVAAQHNGIIDSVNSTASQTQNAVATTSAALLSTTNALAAQAAANASQAAIGVLQSKYDTLAAITNDGDKTRALISEINVAQLNREITVVSNELAEARGDHRSARDGVNVTNNINQNQAQAQQQQQQFLTNGLLSQLIAAQHATNTAVTIGNGNRPTQTASNVNA